MQISIIGSGEKISKELHTIAFDTGSHLVKEGHVIICGGKGGIMEAACHGAHNSAGMCIGILPECDGKYANKYLSITIATGIGELRNGIIVASGDIIVAFPGSYGTLSEIAFALRNKKRLIVVREDLFNFDIKRICNENASYAYSVQEILNTIREYNDI